MPAPQPMPPENRDHSLLSALCDGEAGADEARQACAHWCASAQARTDWHTWAVIGDAMRAESLCASADHDAVFMQRLRERLEDEPVVLAPAPWGEAASARPLSRWAGAGAVAAGLAVVAGAVVMLRTQPAGEESLLATASPPAPTQPAASSPAPTDPALAGYLYAHRQYAPTAMPGGVRPVALQPQQP